MDSNKSAIRVLHVVTYMGRGGLETMLMNYYRHIDRSKVQFDFLVHRDFRADYDDEIESMGGVIYRLPRLVPWSSGYNAALDSFFAAHPEYRIIHVHQDCLSSVILKAAKKHGISVRIAHSHNSSQDKNLKYLIKLFYRRQIPSYATQLFACGKEAGDWMFRGAPYRIMNNAIDSKLYAISCAKRSLVRTSLRISPEAFVLGHVGRFYPQKNHTFLLEVFSEIKTREPDSILLLVGDGPLRAEMEEKARSLGVAESIIFAGVRDDVPDLMQAMDCFVFPSLYEGIPVTMIEAQAAGLPCVVSAGVPEECDKTGLLKRIALSDGISVWAEQVLCRKNAGRKASGQMIIDAGYDIVSNARWLQNYYIEQWESSV